MGPLAAWGLYLPPGGCRQPLGCALQSNMAHGQVASGIYITCLTPISISVCKPHLNQCFSNCSSLARGKTNLVGHDRCEERHNMKESTEDCHTERLHTVL